MAWKFQPELRQHSESHYTPNRRGVNPEAEHKFLLFTPGWHLPSRIPPDRNGDSCSYRNGIYRRGRNLEYRHRASGDILVFQQFIGKDRCGILTDNLFPFRGKTIRRSSGRIIGSIFLQKITVSLPGNLFYFSVGFIQENVSSNKSQYCVAALFPLGFNKEPYMGWNDDRPFPPG